MPLYINNQRVIERITFGRPVAEPPLRNNLLKEAWLTFWRLWGLL
jgi:hypothetical protein